MGAWWICLHGMAVHIRRFVSGPCFCHRFARVFISAMNFEYSSFLQELFVSLAFLRPIVRFGAFFCFFDMFSHTSGLSESGLERLFFNYSLKEGVVGALETQIVLLYPNPCRLVSEQHQSQACNPSWSASDVPYIELRNQQHPCHPLPLRPTSRSQ